MYDYSLDGSNNMKYEPTYYREMPNVSKNTSNNNTTIYNIDSVDLPNVQDPSEFWNELSNGVKRHSLDK